MPDGLLFDIRDVDSPEFYLVEIELVKHDFYKHIFPQITKFFGFYNNPQSQNQLVEKIHSRIKSDTDLEKQFKQKIKGREIFKFIKDAIENSQNILLLMNGNKPELPEIMDTYTDTWEKMVKVLILRQYRNNKETITSLTPDFEGIELEEIISEGSVVIQGEKKVYSEEFHLDGVQPNIRKIYELIKSSVLKDIPNVVFNPMKYYISIRDKKNFVFINIRKSKIRIVVLLKEESVKSRVKYHKIRPLTAGVQKFWGGASCELLIDSESHIDEIIDIIKAAKTK